MRKTLLQLLFLLTCGAAFSQGTILKGVVVNQFTRQPIVGVSVALLEANESTFTAADGTFLFHNLTEGSDILLFSSPEVVTKELPVSILAGQVNDLGNIALGVNLRSTLTEGSFLLIDEETIGENEDRGDYNISSLLSSSDDVYLSETSFNFSAVRFRLRGYDYRYADSYINGVNFSDAERGGFSYGLIGGLNDATRNKDIVNGMHPSAYNYSQLGGATNINTYAGNYAPGGKVSLAYTNRSYMLRGSAIYSTGMMSNGWAVTGSMAYRWADEGYIQGTPYNSLAGFLSVEKKLNDQHRLSLTTFVAPTQRGRSSAVSQQLHDLLGSDYNSYWGYQDGKKRNSRILTTVEPVAILSHTWTIDKDSRLVTGLGFKYTNYGYTAFDRFNAADPRPDYYRNLPEYTSRPEEARQNWLDNVNIRQVDWNNLYYINANRNARGEGAAYVVEERHNDQLNFSLNSTFNTKLNEQVTFTAGIEARTTKGMHYKTVSDLMGADYYLNVNQFAIRDFGWSKEDARYDLNNPDVKLRKGDRFGYDYNLYVNSFSAWLQNVHRYYKWDISYGFKIGRTEFFRDGKMKNSLSPDNSYGEGAHHSFVDQGAKLGLIYKFNGRNMLSGNVSYSTLPPLAYNAYLSPRVKDTEIPDLKSESNFSADLSYMFNYPFIRGRITAYQTSFYDQARIYNMYSDRDGSFVNYALTGINKIHRGIEVGTELTINSNWSVTAVGTLAEYYYSNRPTGTVSFENGSAPDRTETVYMKNFYVSGTPQTAGSLTLNYFNNYWFLDLSLNGFDRVYIDPSPIKRTESTIASITADTNEELIGKIEKFTEQEKFAGGATLDFSIGKMLRIQRKYNLNVNLQFNNILNNKKLKTGGYEYNRVDAEDSLSNKFPSSYYYAQGFNCFLNVGFRF